MMHKQLHEQRTNPRKKLSKLEKDKNGRIKVSNMTAKNKMMRCHQQNNIVPEPENHKVLGF